MEALKIVGGCILAAALYGVLNDEVTARVCLQYFTVLHPPRFHTESPTLLGIGWGIYATWPVGFGLGIVFAICARGGQQPKLTLSDLAPLLLRLLGIIAVGALASGTLGYFFGPLPARESYLLRITPTVRAGIPPGMVRRFVADWWAHIASYAIGIVGGLACCILVYRKRARARNADRIAAAPASA
jgi:hypothetical protein